MASTSTRQPSLVASIFGVGGTSSDRGDDDALSGLFSSPRVLPSRHTHGVARHSSSELLPVSEPSSSERASSAARSDPVPAPNESACSPPAKGERRRKSTAEPAVEKEGRRKQSLWENKKKGKKRGKRRGGGGAEDCRGEKEEEEEGVNRKETGLEPKETGGKQRNGKKGGSDGAKEKGVGGSSSGSGDEEKEANSEPAPVDAAAADATSQDEAFDSSTDPADKEGDNDDDDKATLPNDPAAEGRTIFVGNLPPNTTRRSLAAMFKKCGAVESARIRCVAVTGVKLPKESAGNQNLMRKVCANTHRIDADTPKHTAQGYVVFASAGSVPAALELNNSEIRGGGTALRLRVDTASPTVDSSRSVFVGNLPYKSDESTLREHFISGSGGDLERDDVVGVRVVRDANAQVCKGFGYVLLRDRTMVPAALGLHGTEYMRRMIRVMVCGKKFKGKRGREEEEEEEEVSGSGSGGGGALGMKAARIFEGRRAAKDDSATTRRAVDRAKSAASGAGAKKQRKRGPAVPPVSRKPGQARKAGLSKRAAAEAKAGKRIKKIRKRAERGMGKAKRLR